ncbi:Histidine-phosphotransfer domain HPT domain-containing protein [Mycena sanguinolenta]|uniref:Histidine-phosphotransfer domain HPT domain-containing protein n=1 Tax=Mycena sanguinolenta TaxID=230812 RepID=A0A8H6XRD3_9AGAR|nr:Histidine-phosphotransfer domain HPT domain-containing protein [Mycena sanguinolenta]
MSTSSASTSSSNSPSNQRDLDWRVPSALPTVDSPAFSQILELDDPDDGAHTYSKDMFELYASQAPATFKDMDRALSAADFRTLADRAHFLMGSSAALGVARVAAVCEEMERVAKARLALASEHDEPILLVPTPAPASVPARDPTRDPSTSDESQGGLSEEQALKQIAALLEVGKREYAQAERWLRGWYVEHAGAAPPPSASGVDVEEREQGAAKSTPASREGGAAGSSKAPPRPTDSDATPAPTRTTPPVKQLQTDNPPINR